MRKTPTYDWYWFETHAPFKKIFKEACELEIKKEIVSYYSLGFREFESHYHIKLNYKMLQDSFEEIKRRLLSTRVCKYNEEIYDYVNEIECDKHDITYLIIDSCTTSSCPATYSWELY